MRFSMGAMDWSVICDRSIPCYCLPVFFVLIAYEINEGSEEHAHITSFAITSTARIHKSVKLNERFNKNKRVSMTWP